MSSALILYSSEQVRELDRIAIEELGIPGFELMQRAAKAVFERMRSRYPAAREIVVLCGPGNNGGDGFLVGLLALQAKLKVRLLMQGEVSSLGGDARLAMQAFVQGGGKIATESGDLEAFLGQSDVIVDALLGTGLSRPVEGKLALLIETANCSDVPVISIDIPSGLQSDRGVAMGATICADTTVTFIGMKAGLVTGQARDYVGRLWFDDLAIPEAAYQRLKPSPDRYIISDGLLPAVLKPRQKTSHKGYFGHVLLIGGDQGMSGAIRLAGEAALRSGAGLVSIATHPAHAHCLNSGRPELMVHAVNDAETLATLIGRADVIGIGPGLGRSGWGQLMLQTVLATDRPKVLDADALNLLDDKTRKRSDWVLTPHPGEAARLLQLTTTDIEADRYQSIRQLQDRFGGVCVLKGAGTLVADDASTYACVQGNPGMASGGMGDVLTGILCGILAQLSQNVIRLDREKGQISESNKSHNTLFDAAKTAVWLHANAADRAARYGEAGMLASDLMEEIRSLISNAACRFNRKMKSSERDPFLEIKNKA